MQPTASASSASSVLSETTCYTISPAQIKGQTLTKPKRSKREALKKFFTIPPAVEQTMEGRMQRQRAAQGSLMMTRAM